MPVCGPPDDAATGALPGQVHRQELGPLFGARIAQTLGAGRATAAEQEDLLNMGCYRLKIIKSMFHLSAGERAGAMPIPLLGKAAQVLVVNIVLVAGAVDAHCTGGSHSARNYDTFRRPADRGVVVDEDVRGIPVLDQLLLIRVVKLVVV